MKVIKENLKRCNAFYKSDFYHYLENNDPGYIEVIYTYMCEDPDACDEVLYQKLGEKFNLTPRKNYLIDIVDGVKIRLAADVICGRKQIVKFHNKEFDKWIKDYEKVRSNLCLHFLWPKHKAPTINTYRFNMYHDRIDYLLYDLKCHFNGEITRMNPAYIQPDTKLWLSKFNNDFKLFIDTMKLNFLVNENYEVLDIATMQKEIIKSIPELKEIKESMHIYMKCMLELNRKNKFIIR